MRRFPAPPGATGPYTPSTNRSAEAPMQYEWEKPRQFPTSPFQTAADDGERARKRTHYDAMEVDTPPRPATSHSNPLAPSQLNSDVNNTPLEPLSFDAKDFHPKEALGFNGQEVEEVIMADNAEELVDREEKENLALSVRGEPLGGTARRRNVSAKGKRRNQPTIETDDEEDGTDDDGQSGGFLGTLQKKVGKRAAGGEFSFQVHHHHAPSSSSSNSQLSGQDYGQVGSAPERWLQSNTPYVLLGYLQFGSLTLLAILVLSLLMLFLYTLYVDIQTRLSSLTLELRAEILQCAKAYVDNRCEPGTRIPAMERRCADWEDCMNREVVVTGKTRVVAETLAEIVNGFVDVISFKTMLFVLLTLGITIYGSSAALSLLSSRASSHSASTSQPPHYYPYPPHQPPYGLPYQPGQWVVENGNEGVKNQLGLGARPQPGMTRRPS